MENWYDSIKNLGVYNHRKGADRLPNYHISLEETLSPLSNLLLNIYEKTITEKNLIISYPDNVLKLIPILGYIYAKKENKSVLIFTSNYKGFKNKSLREFHNLNYCMLSNNGAYTFYEYVIGHINSHYKLTSEIKFPRSAKRHVKNTIKKNLLDRFKLKDPKILLFSGSDLEISDKISEVQIGSDFSIHENTLSDIGLIIFENIDLYINSKYTLKKFLEWLENYKNCRFVFHFSNPNSKFVDILKKETNSFVIPFNKELIMETPLFKESVHYYSNLNDRKLTIIQDYNVDSKDYFIKNSEEKISIIEPLVKSGNYEYYYFEAKKILKQIDPQKILNKPLFYASKKLLYSFMTMAINPLRFKVKFYSEQYGYKYFNTVSFLSFFEQELNKEEDKLTKNLLKEYVGSLFSIAMDLGNTKGFGENDPFKRKGKEHYIIDIAKNKEKYFGNDNNLIICCFNAIEVSIIENALKKLNIKGVLVKNIHWLHKSLLDNKEEYNLLLPGVIPLKYLSELLMPYSEIRFVSYEGINYKRIKEQITSLKQFNETSNIRLIEYYKEIFTQLNETEDKIIKEFENIQNNSNQNIIEICSKEDKDDEKISEDYISSIVKNIFKTSENYEEYLDQEITEREIIKNSYKLKNNEREYKGETLTFTLENVETRTIINKKLPVNKSFTYFTSSEELLEGSPKNIKLGDFLVFIDNDDKKSLTEQIIEMYGLETAVDLNAIEYWKNRLMSYVEENKLNYAAFNRKYNENGIRKTIPATTRWVKGEALGPKYAQDLYFIGKTIEDGVIIENYEYMFVEIEKIRNIHRITGRRLNKVIKQILDKKSLINTKELGLTGTLFYDKVKNGIYEVIEIKK